MRSPLAWATLAGLAACATPGEEPPLVEEIPDAEVSLRAAYDPSSDRILLSWETQHAAGCLLDGRPVETWGESVPLSAPDVPAIVDVTLVCEDRKGSRRQVGVRVFHGPDRELVVGAGSVTLDDLTRLEIVHGSLRLADPAVTTSDVEALLGSVRVVTRSLVIAEDAELTSLEPLASIEAVHGDLVIQDDDLWNLAGFSTERFRGSLVLDGANGLEDLTTLPREVVDLGGGLVLVNNRSLVSLEGAERIASLGGDLRIVGNMGLDRLADRDDLGLSGVKRIDGDVIVESNPVMTALWSRAAQLDEIAGSVRIIGNPALQDAAGLARVQVIGGDLILRDNDDMADFPSLFLEALGGSLVIRGNELLDRIGAFGILGDIGGDVLVEDNDALGSLDFLSALQAIGGELRIDTNPELRDVLGLSALGSVGSHVAVARNRLLCPAAVDAVLGAVTAGGTYTNVSNGTGAACP